MDIYNNVIMEHFRNPVNFSRDLQGQLYENSSCGDSIIVNIQISDDKSIIFKYNSIGCALSVASASILSSNISGLIPSEAEALVTQFLDEMEEGNFKNYSGLEALQSMKKYQSRINCIKLPWHAVLSELKKK